MTTWQADVDGDGRVSLPELAQLLDGVHDASAQSPRSRAAPSSFPERVDAAALGALAGALQLLPLGRATEPALSAARQVERRPRVVFAQVPPQAERERWMCA